MSSTHSLIELRFIQELNWKRVLKEEIISFSSGLMYAMHRHQYWAECIETDDEVESPQIFSVTTGIILSSSSTTLTCCQRDLCENLGSENSNYFFRRFCTLQSMATRDRVNIYSFAYVKFDWTLMENWIDESIERKGSTGAWNALIQSGKWINTRILRSILFVHHLTLHYHSSLWYSV